jgi:hypothetical protein
MSKIAGKFSGFLTVVDRKTGQDVTDIVGPSVSADSEAEVIRLLLPLQEAEHTGFIILNSETWSFSSFTSVDDFITE